MNAHIKSYIEIYKKQHSKLSPFECLVIFRESQVEFAKFCVISRNIKKKNRYENELLYAKVNTR